MGPKPKKKQKKNRHLANDILKVELDRSRVPLKRSLRVTTKPGDFCLGLNRCGFSKLRKQTCTKTSARYFVGIFCSGALFIFHC